MKHSAQRDQQITRLLSRWFRTHARDLPWRRKRTGYRALVAELMLQQTQVARVLEHYVPFLKRFPSLRALAEADEQEVLAHWQGLGYYRRARHLHAAARAVMSAHRGRLPRSAAALESLPGVGRYTAGAIASIVHDEPVPIVDGNVTRVLSRIEGRQGPAHDTKGQAAIWSIAERLVSRAESPGVFNEALMELGAIICTPRAPRCSECPLASHCRAYGDRTQHLIPPPKPTARRNVIHHHAVVFRRGDRILLEQRPDRGLWAAMWQVPTVEAENELTTDHLRAALPYPAVHLEPRTTFLHETTHRRVTFHVYLGTTRVRRGVWQPVRQLNERPLSNPQRFIVKTILHEANVG
ncbi:MAG: A/G-specific adenine glycosylase [Phycisphaerales bacterium]|nr:MAG: A/G-specific adenine glycosylase [Phycisphaerales bacterium]